MAKICVLALTAAFCAFFRYDVLAGGTNEGVDLVVSGYVKGEAPFAPKGNSFSAAVRVKVETPLFDSGRLRLVMSSGNGWHNGFRLCLRADIRKETYRPVIEFGKGSRPTAWALEGPGGSVMPGRWHRIAATWDGKIVRLYVDGREVASGRHEEAYAPAGERMARIGVPGEKYGILSLPCLIDRATVWERCISRKEVVSYDPGAAFEPDTPEFAAFAGRIIRGEIPSENELLRAKKGVHCASVLLQLDKALALAQLGRKDPEASIRLRDEVIGRMLESSGGKSPAAEFTDRWREVAIGKGHVQVVLRELRTEFADLRNSSASHLPYAALQLMKTAELAGYTKAAGKIRRMILAMDLRSFPQIRTELGEDAEYTAHGQPGASVSAAMPSFAFHVSPDGDDSADGSAERPFRTLRRARDAVRAERKANGLPPGGIAVRLHGGRYRITETLELSEEDSGERDRPVVWCAYGNEMPVLDGGFVLPPLKKPADGAVLERIPAAARAHVRCCDVQAAGTDALEPMRQYGYYRDPPAAVTDLYENGELLELSRYPNKGWLRVGKPVEGPAGVSVFRTSLGDLNRWAKEPDLAATGFWKYFWADLTTSVTNVDVKAGTLAVRVDVPNPGGRIRHTQVTEGKTYFLLNALCALDSPGEWYLDRKAGMLYVWPKNGEESHFVLSAYSKPFVVLRNVHDMRIEGLTFEHGRGSGVQMNGCRECVFAGNVVRRFGGNGVNIHDSLRMTVSDNVMRVFGHGALEVSGGDRKTLAHSGNRVTNNDFSTVERRRRTYAPHLHLSGVGAEVSFNRFSDSPSSAMRLEGNDFYIVSNLVENVLLESDDQGGLDIYFNSSYFGNRYCWNTWRNIGRVSDNLPCGQAAIRFDGNISGQTVYGNRFENCGTGEFGAIQSCGGRMHVIDNNLFVNCNRGMSIANYPIDFWTNKIQRTLVKPCLQQVCITNAPFTVRYPGIENLLWTNQVNHLVRNVMVGATPLLLNPPQDTVAYGNFRFAEMPDLDKLSRESAWRPVPEASETGPRRSARLSRAYRNDSRRYESGNQSDQE